MTLFEISGLLEEIAILSDNIKLSYDHNRRNADERTSI